MVDQASPHLAGLPPVARGDARVLVLGSLPGAASLAASRYYWHPRNQFWPLICGVIDRDLTALDYDARLAALQDARIALWDVAASARRRGSLDQTLADVTANDLAALAAHLPDLRAVGFNGGAAWRLGRAAFAARPDLTLAPLPSSSPAHTRPLADKAARWAVLRPFLAPC